MAKSNFRRQKFWRDAVATRSGISFFPAVPQKFWPLIILQGQALASFHQSNSISAKPNMLSKYFITTKGLQISSNNKP
jgi:hypothetical protein